MNDLFFLMIKPFAACLILAGIHVYLGLHVIGRGVIFVDLALAQVAALGATVGFVFGFGLHTSESYVVSLCSTVLVAAVFSFLRNEKSEVPQEAYIGIAYAVATAAAILILSVVPEGGEELKALLVGHVLFVEWNEITYMALIYSAIGLFHWLSRRQMLAVSLSTAEGAAEAAKAGIKVRFWDFLFYLTLGVVVTSSVEIAGVLLVFSFLVVPSVCGMLLATSIQTRLIVGWVCGFLTSIFGILASYYFDLPTGATVVCAFGVCLLICLMLSGLLARVSSSVNVT